MTAPQDPFAAPDEGQPPPAAPMPAAPYEPTPYGQPPGYADAPSHGAGQAYGVAGPPARNGFGTAALICGILAVLGTITVVGGVLFGILAVVFGVLGRGRVKRHEATNGSSATAGLVLGVVGLVLSIALVALGLSLLTSGNGKDLQDCLRSAGTNQAAVQRCQDEFRKNFRY